jgi:coproporphyrinogen III oxidase-like Fe-S oxidoreductase
VAAEDELLTAEQARREDIMLGMRLKTGVKKADFAAAGLQLVSEGLRGAELIESDESGTRLRCTSRGWLLGNEVFSRIWLAD